MNVKIFLLGFVIIITNCCGSPKASGFRESIIQKENVASQIILGKESSEAKKLDGMAKDDFKNALAAFNQQEVEFDKLISSIEMISADGIQEGEPLKIAAIKYYRSLKALHFHERNEIAHKAFSSELDRRDPEVVYLELIKSARIKKSLFEKVYESEKMLSKALVKFDSVNGF